MCFCTQIGNFKMLISPLVSSCECLFKMYDSAAEDSGTPLMKLRAEGTKSVFLFFYFKEKERCAPCSLSQTSVESSS